MKKDKMIIFLVIVFCFVLVNVAAQLTINEGYIRTTTLLSGHHYAVHADYSFATRLVPVALTVIVLLIVFISFSDKDTSWVARFDKRLFGDNKKRV